MSRPPPSEPRTPAAGREEQTVYGVRAALALLTHRPQDVRRIFHGPALRPRLGEHLAAAARRHLPYRELDADALTRAAGSPHHEGLVVVAAPLRYRALEAPPAGHAAPWLALDGVENPHNLGAILRTAAFFGVGGVLAGGAAPGDKVNAAVLRVAEGGAEAVPLYGAAVLAEGLGHLRAAGFRVLGLETDAGRALAEALADGSAGGPGAPRVLVLGGEHAGLSPAARRACDGLCRLEGAGSMDSLNVSVAAAVALAEMRLIRSRPAAESPATEPAARTVPEPWAPPPRPPRRRAESPEGRGEAQTRRAPGRGRRASGGRSEPPQARERRGKPAKGGKGAKAGSAGKGGKAGRPRR